MVKNSLPMQEMWVQSLGWKDPLEKEMEPTPVFFLENPKNRGAWQAAVHGVARVGHNLANEPPPFFIFVILVSVQ